MANEPTINVRIIARAYPPEKQINPALVFGMQDKQKVVHTGDEQTDGSVWFDCALRVRLDGDAPNFLGDFAHGTPKKRFIYLALGDDSTGIYQGIKRLKIHLSSITKAMVQQVLDADGWLQVEVAGTGAASVPLLDDGWTVVTT